LIGDYIMFVRPPKEKKEKVNFVDNKEFYKELVKYSRKNYEGKIPDELGKFFATMAEKMTEARCFAGYTFKDDLIGNALVDCFKYIDRYDTRRKNPFAYFTTMIYFSFLRTIAKNKKNREEKLAYLQKQISLFKDMMRESYGSDRAVNRELGEITNYIEELLV
jgi:DNA-directed RNA polymerase specialized sigma subunit